MTLMHAESRAAAGGAGERQRADRLRDRLDAYLDGLDFEVPAILAGLRWIDEGKDPQEAMRPALSALYRSIGTAQAAASQAT
jgi:hypothetical protein